MSNKNLKKVVSITGLLLVVTILVFVVIGNQNDKNPLEEVERTIVKMQQDLNKEKVDSFVDYIADDYGDNKGFNKEKIKKELNNFKVIYQNFNVKILDSQVKMNSNTEAKVNLKVQLTAGIRLLGQQQKILNVEAMMRKEQDVWVISHSRWDLEIQPMNQGLN